jgi:digeranylgeranylglycerophospholipid reductase
VDEKADIIVVGGGPSGSFSALSASRLGADVLVCEEHKEIGVPHHCGGHLNLRGLERLGLHLPLNIIENEIRGAIFHSPSGKKFVVRRTSPVTCIVNRELFDKYLSDLAIKYGTRYSLESRVKSFIFNSNSVTGVVVEKGRTKRSLASSVVIDAEGCSSTLLKKTKLQTLDGSMVVKAIQAEVDRVDEVDLDMVEVYLGRKYAPGFFAWIIPKRNSSAKVGLATRTGNPQKYLHRFMNHHPVASQKLRRSNITGLSLHPIPLGGAIPKTYSNGFLVVGDAASQVKPTTGGGVIVGLSCAKIAGEIAYEAIMTKDFSANFLSRYPLRWRKMIGFDLAVMRQTRKLLNRLSDNKMNKIVDLCAKLGVNRILEEGGDIDLQGRSLLRMIKNPIMLIAMFYFIFSSMTSQIGVSVE